MNQSEQINELAGALSKFQATVGQIKKNKKATIQMKKGGNFSYSYADLPGVLEAITKPLSEQGLALVQGCHTRENGAVVLSTKLIHSSGQWMESSMPINANIEDIKQLGMQITYCRRYAITAVVGICADDDNEECLDTNTTKPAKPQTVSKEQVAELKSLLNGDAVRLKNMLEWLKKQHKVGSIEQMPADAYERLRPVLLAQKEAEQAEQVESKIEELAF